MIDLTAQGFTLIGGRLDYVGGRALGAVVYKRRSHVINLFVAQGANAEHRAKTETVQGFNIRRWSERGLNYWAVSDLGSDELDGVRREIRGGDAEQRDGVINSSPRAD